MIRFPKVRGSEEQGRDTAPLPDAIRADLGPFPEEVLSAFSRRTGLPVREGDPWLLLRQAPTEEEGYRLRVEQGRVTLEAATEKGVIHGLTTLYLRLEDGMLSDCRICDSPKYPHRGLSLDCARHFFPKEEVEAVLEQMALVKTNVLHFHLSDDQGWRIESLRFPALHRQSREYYTRQELRDLVAFARVRGIDVIPEIDLPGHTTAILAAFPELGCTGERPELATEGGIYTRILCAGSDRVYRFLEELLQETMELFPDERFHIGGDEAPKLQWSRCPRCAGRLRALGGSDFEQLQTDFTRRVIQILEKNGKRPVCWNEALKGGLPAEALQIQYWTVEGWKQLKDHARAGRPFVYSPMFETYLDYPYAMTPVRKLYRLRPRLGGRSCDAYAGMLGIEAALWTEHIDTPERLHSQLFPRLWILAELAWSGGHEGYPLFRRQLEALCALARKKGIVPMDASRWDPRGRQRRQEALGFFLRMNSGGSPDNTQKTQPDLRMMATYVARFFKLSDLPALYDAYFR